jgi:hypothetical protein
VRIALVIGACLLLAACSRAAPAHPAAELYPFGCVIDPNGDEHANCLRAEGDGYRMNPAVLRALTPPGKQLFSLRTHAGFFWVRADGFARATPVFDNWADYFCDGLTRTIRGEHMGFMNAQLEIIVPPTYDFVSPFRGGRAAVCRDCQKEEAGEHTAISCNKCQIVDTHGSVVSAQEQASAAIWEQLPAAADDECSE